MKKKIKYLILIIFIIVLILAIADAIKMNGFLHHPTTVKAIPVKAK